MPNPPADANTQHNQTPLFDIRHLSVNTKHKQLLAIDKLTLPQGRLVALIGANGAGKSTLLNALLGKVAGCQLTGDVLCQGRPVADAVAAGEMAWVGQHETFELPLTALDYALLGVVPRLNWYQKPSHKQTQEAKALLAAFDLLALADKRITQLSGGEKQRLAIVRALMQGTQILLLDEPSNHLDIKHERLLFDYLRRLVDTQGLSIIVVLHSLTHAYRFADHVIAIHQGRCFAQGTPDEVMTHECLQALYDTPIHRHTTPDGVVFL